MKSHAGDASLIFVLKLMLAHETSRVVCVCVCVCGPHFTGPAFADRFREVLGYGIFNTDGMQHKVQRQVASHLFTRNSLSEFMMQVHNKHFFGSWGEIAVCVLCIVCVCVCAFTHIILASLLHALSSHRCLTNMPCYCAAISPNLIPPTRLTCKINSFATQWIPSAALRLANR